MCTAVICGSSLVPAGRDALTLGTADCRFCVSMQSLAPPRWLKCGHARPCAGQRGDELWVLGGSDEKCAPLAPSSMLTLHSAPVADRASPPAAAPFSATYLCWTCAHGLGERRVPQPLVCYARPRTQTHTNTYAHTQARTHARTHASTHAHKHARKLVYVAVQLC